MSTPGLWSSIPGNSLIACTNRALSAKEAVGKNGYVDLAKALPQAKGVCAYAFKQVDLDAVRRAALYFGSPCDLAVWVNGKEVLRHTGARGAVADQEDAGGHGR